VTGWIPEPTVILVGCQPWPPKSTGPGCPACGDGIRSGQDTHYCAVCDALSPRREAQVRSAQLGLKGRDRAAVAEKAAHDRLRAKTTTSLTEAERRRLWNGYRGTILSEVPELTNLARAGREFLAEIGQEPNWSLLLDRRGNVIGRTDEGMTP
jgi:hypothetical protein